MTATNITPRRSYKTAIISAIVIVGALIAQYASDGFAYAKTAVPAAAASYVAFATAAPGTATAAGCSASRFSILSDKGSVEYGFMTVVGRVRNDNAIACGVQMKLDVMDKADALLDTNESWPASVSNIAPGATYSFKLMQRVQDGATSYVVTTVSARQW
jgi:hypothetical protein